MQDKIGVNSVVIRYAGRVGICLLFVIFLLILLVLFEYGLRAIKSSTYDGALYVSRPSINNIYHKEYGWVSPPNQIIHKKDDCYGKGVITYNADGFRSRDLSSARTADYLVCILGDSTMQGFQLPDGSYLPHMLENELRKYYDSPFVLPLAVGGYGQTQQWMLFQDYCEFLEPDLVIQHWADNDPVNNSFMAERYGGVKNNNARHRPYYERGGYVMRSPYPVSISPKIDGWLTIKLLNTLLLDVSKRNDLEYDAYIEEGWDVAEHFSRKLMGGYSDRAIVLVEENQDRAINMFKNTGLNIATYRSFTEEEMCMPRDTHPNTKGHRNMLDSLLSLIGNAKGKVTD